MVIGGAQHLSEASSRRPLRLLGVFAHPDDETLCAGGTFATYASSGAEVRGAHAVEHRPLLARLVVDAEDAHLFDPETALAITRGGPT